MITFILARPQMGENIGAAARALANFGFTDLRIVAPRDGWPNERADATASGAFDRIQVTTFDTLSEAISDLDYTYATTARLRDMVKPVFTSTQIADDAKHKRKEAQKIGFVFGAERTGLLNEEISLCQAIINIETHPDFSSLNLAQCVLLICYAIKDLASIDVAPVIDAQNYANNNDKQQFLDRLIADLEDRRFFRSEDLKPTMLRNIENIFTRHDLTQQEVKTLHGILSALRGNKTRD